MPLREAEEVLTMSTLLQVPVELPALVPVRKSGTSVQHHYHYPVYWRDLTLPIKLFVYTHSDTNHNQNLISCF